MYPSDQEQASRRMYTFTNTEQYHTAVWLPLLWPIPLLPVSWEWWLRMENRESSRMLQNLEIEHYRVLGIEIGVTNVYD